MGRLVFISRDERSRVLRAYNWERAIPNCEVVDGLMVRCPCSLYALRSPFAFDLLLISPLFVHYLGSRSLINVVNCSVLSLVSFLLITTSFPGILKAINH